MRTRILIGCAIVASAGLGAFTASGFGDRGDEPAELTVTTLDTHAVEAPPAGAPAVGKRRASLFKLLYRTTDPVPAPVGYSSYTLAKCPKGGGVVNGFHLRTGGVTSGVLAAGTFPDGVRKWTYVIDNVTGAQTNVRFGIVCIK